MIEQAIYFGLGCVVTGLLALAFLPVLWARAMRLTRRRLQARIPVSMQEILADRDHLRAEFAVERRKLEQAVERVRLGKAHDLSELGRRAAETLALSERIAALEVQAQERDRVIADLSWQRNEAQAQLGSLQQGLHRACGDLDRQTDVLEALRASHHVAETLAEERRTTVAGLHTRTMGLEMTIEDAARARTGLERQLEAAKHTISQITAERDALSLGPPSPQVDAAALEKAGSRIAQLEAALENAQQEAKEREKGFHLQKSLRQVERARGHDRAQSQKLDALQAENAALRGALSAARLQPAVETEWAKGDAALRASIHEIGLAVARMTAQAMAEGSDGSAAPPLAPQRPDRSALEVSGLT